MQENLELFFHLNELHWRGSFYQWFFYAGILLTLVFEKRRMLRIVFCWVPILFLLCIFNPIFLKLMNWIGLNQEYFVRMFSFMPLMYVIARSLTMLLSINHSLLKLVGVGIVCAIICIAGHNIYSESWIVSTKDYSKVPKETYAIINTIAKLDGGSTCIAAIDASTVYLRQTEDVIMPYGRNGDELGVLLAMDPPDVRRVMELAGRQDVDYVVARRTDAVLATFLKNKYRPIALTSDYAIYRVENVSRLKRTFNGKRQVVSRTNYDSTGRIDDSGFGYATEAFVYDSNGHCTRVTYLDKNGQVCEDALGYASVQRSYYINGQVRSQVYFDRYNRPMLFQGRYKTGYTYKDNRVACEKYYDKQGRAMNRQDTLYARKDISYNYRGEIISERYYDDHGKATLSYSGYASIDRVYDECSRVIQEKYGGTDGLLVNCIGGFAGFIREYDETGRITLECYYDEKGENVDLPSTLKSSGYDFIRSLIKQNPYADGGIQYSWDSTGACAVTGEARGGSEYTLLQGDRPFFFFNNRTYLIRYASDKVCLRVYFYEDSSCRNMIGSAIQTYGDTEFTVPDNCAGMSIRLWVARGETVDEVIRPSIELA